MRRRLIVPVTLVGVLIAAAAQAGLPGDANCDGHVDTSDLAALAENAFGQPQCADADANGDGIVTAADFPALVRLLPIPTIGPIVTFFGVASAAGDPTQPIGGADDGAPIYWRPAALGFKVVIEGTTGLSGAIIGRTVEPHTGRPDLQLETDQVLGDGSFDHCPGTVPAIAPPDFGAGSNIDDALRAAACGFQVSTTRASGCTLDALGNSDWIAANTQVQFCLQIESLRQFPSGQTRLTVQLRDLDGNVGPLQSIIVQVGAMPPATATRTRTPTATLTARATATMTRAASITVTPSLSATPTRTGTTAATVASATPVVTAPSFSPTRTATPTASASPSSSPRTATPTFNGASPTPTASPSRSATASRTATPSPTTTGTTPIPPRTPTPSPSSTSSPTRSSVPTVTPTRSPTAQLTATPTFTRTPTWTPTITPTLGADAGPAITFFGVSDPDNHVTTPIGNTIDGIPIYQRNSPFGFVLIVEGKPGTSKRPVGSKAFNYDPSDPTVRPDLQIEVDHPLGNGSTAVCDNSLPKMGGVPAVDPPSFDFTQPISNTLNDLGCRFINGSGVPGGRGSSEACTVFVDGSYHFVNKASTIQFCGQIVKPFQFSAGDTLVTVRLRDTGGNLGPMAQLLLRD